MTSPPRPRRHIGSLPSYVPGTPAQRPDGSPGYKLSSNESPEPPSRVVLEAVAAAAAGANRYPAGGVALAQRLAAIHQLDPERVLVSGGSLTLLRDLLTGYAGHGTEVVFGWRSYEAYPILAQSSGARGVAVPLAGQRLDLAAIGAAVGRRTRVVLLPNPNNPTSTTVPLEGVAELADSLPRNCLLVLDAAYCEFAGAGLEAAGLELARRRPNLVLLRTFSKAFGLAGIRIGWAVADPRVVATLRRVALPFALTAMAEAAGLAALERPADMEARVRATVAERGRVLAALRGAGLAVPESSANFVWLPLGAASAEFAAACSAGGLSVRCFVGEGVRVTVGAPQENDAFLAVARSWRRP